MSFEKAPFVIEENPYLEFETLLDTTCFRLQKKQAQYTLRRLSELDTVLANLEKELDSIVRETAF
jgi:hypothetical protein